MASSSADSPTDVLQELEQALAAGKFEAAQPQIAAYGRQVREQLRAATSKAEREQIFHTAIARLERFQQLSRAMRAHLHSRLQTVSGGIRYQAYEPPQHRWHVEG